MIVLQLAWIVCCALALCCYVGWGVCRLALPAALATHRALFVPLVGYALCIWVGYLGVSSVLNLRWSLVALLALATMINVLAWRRTGAPGVRWLGGEWPLLVLLTLALLAGVWPLVAYGFLTTIGQGWDTEAYLPMAQYLVDYPVRQIPAAPQNPLRNLVANPPVIGLTLGHSVLHGFTMLLSWQDPLATFAPIQALLRTLGVLAAYLWLRCTMGLQRWPALASAALFAAGALLLWVAFFNFGMQLASVPLIPLGLTLGLAAVDELAGMGKRMWSAGARRAITTAALAGVAVAAIPVAYYPALSIFAPLALALGAVRLPEAARRGTRPGLLPLLGAVFAVAVLAALFAAPTVRDYFAGFSFRYSVPGQKIGPDRFITESDVLGLTAFRLAGGGAQPLMALVWLGLALWAALTVAGLVLPRTGIREQGSGDREQGTGGGETQNRSSFFRLRWQAVLLALVVAIGWQRFGKPFEYGYMKSAAYAGFVLWGAAAFGADRLAAWLRGRNGLALASAALVVPLVVAGWAQTLMIREHARGPAVFTRDVAAVIEAARLVPPDAPVLISNDETFVGPNSGLYATAFYGRPIWGHLSTAYTGLDSWPAGELPQFALLAANETAWPLTLGGREVWRSNAAALYDLRGAAPTLSGRSDLASTAPPLDRNAPAELAIWRRGGALREARPDAPLVVLLGEPLQFGPGTPAGNPGQRSIELVVASLQPQTVRLQHGDADEAQQVPAGVSHLHITSNGPQTLTITPEAPLTLIRASTTPEDTQPAGIQQDDYVVWQPTVQQRGPVISIGVTTANPGRHALRLGLTVVENRFSGAQRAVQVLGALPLKGTWQLNIDPVRGGVEALVNGTPTPLLNAQAAPAADGAYFAVLTLYNGEEVIAQAPLLTMRVAGGQVTDLAPQPFSLEAVRAVPTSPFPGNQRALLGQPVTLDNGQASLQRAVLTHTTPWPGAGADAPLQTGTLLRIALGWRAEQPNSQPLMVSLQVLGSGDRKYAQWDGVLGGDWRPIQGWQAGDQVRQDVPLTLDPSTPPGEYRLLLVAYDPATGPQAFGGQQALELARLQVGQ